MRLHPALLALLFLAGHASAQTARKYSNEFLKVGVGARAAAMGNAATALADDATAGYWNPAALTGLKNPYELSLMHAEQFAGVVKYDYAGFATKIDDQSSLAFTFVRLGVDDIPNTLNFKEGNTFNYARITSFAVADMALLIGYARKIGTSDKLSVGGNFKLIHRQIGPFGSAWGFGIDAAVLYTPGKWRLGLVATDLTSTFNLWTYNTEPVEATFIATGNEIPVNNIELTLPAVRLGIARGFDFGQRVRLNATLEVESTFDGERNTPFTAGNISFDPRMGLEAGYKNLVFVRAGFSNLQFVQEGTAARELTLSPTTGIGLNIPLNNYTLQVDYALTNFSGFEQNLYSNLVSVRFGFKQLKFD